MRASFATIVSSHGRSGAPSRNRPSARYAFTKASWAASSASAADPVITQAVRNAMCLVPPHDLLIGIALAALGPRDELVIVGWPVLHRARTTTAAPDRFPRYSGATFSRRRARTRRNASSSSSREPGAQALVEADRGLGQAVEELVARVGELHADGAPVVGIARALDQAGLLEPVQVVRERRPLDADRGGEVLLGAPALLLERQQDQPDRLRAPGLGQLALEGAAEQLALELMARPIGSAAGRWVVGLPCACHARTEPSRCFDIY